MRVSCLWYNYEQMKPTNKAGFTIIETILFLGITGALIVGVLVGAGTSINAQRYRDSVSSLRSFLQQQYSEVLNVSNDTTDSACEGISLVNHGQSRCVILGRYITGNSNSLTSKMVIGATDETVSLPSDDIAALNLYDITVSNTITDDDKYDVEWGSLLNTVDGNPMSFTILILRSPTSGVIRTFIDDTAIRSDIRNLIKSTSPALNTSATICVNSNGLFTGDKMAVSIEKNATSADGIDSKGGANGCH